VHDDFGLDGLLAKSWNEDQLSWQLMGLHLLPLRVAVTVQMSEVTAL
jgi:hypothetical protein